MGGRALVLPQQVMTEATALAGTYVQSGQKEQQLVKMNSSLWCWQAE
jgi:hypothetical protein